MRFDFEAFGEKQVSRELLRIGSYAGDARPLWFQLIRKIMGWNRKQFESGGHRASGGWAPLKPATVEFKKRHNLDPRILIATGALMESLTKLGAKNQTVVVQEDQMVFRSTLPYGIPHQKPKSSSNLPRRRIIEFRPKDRSEIIKDIQQYVLKGKLSS